MSSAVEFVLSLIEKISGPAAKAASALGGTATALEKVKGKSGDVEERLNRAGGVMTEFQKRAESAKPGFQDFGDILSGLGKTAGVAAAAAAVLGGALAVAALDGAKFAGEMANFREDTTFALTAMLGTAERAQGVFKLSQDIADTIGGRPTEVAAQLKGLLRSGFSEQGAKELVQTFADLSALNPGTNLDTFSMKLQVMREEGFASSKTLKEFEKSGLNIGSFFKHLSTNQGIPLKAAHAALKAGTITADQATLALKQTVLDMGGGEGLGALANKFSTTTITGRLNRLHGAVENLFLGLDSGRAGEAIGKVIDKVTELLNPNTAGGARTLQVLNDIASAASDVIEYLSNPNAIGETFDVIVGAARAVLPPLKALGGGLFDGLLTVLGPVASGIMSVVSSLSGVSGGAGAFRVLGQVFGVVAAVIAVAVAAVAIVILAIPVAAWAVVSGVILAFKFIGGAMKGVGAKISGAVDGIMSTLGSLAASAVGLGGDIVQGLIDGISGGVEALKSVVEGMGHTVISTLKGVLDTHSPSKVMEAIGAYTAEGFAIGIDGGVGGVRDSARSMAAEPTNVSPGGGGGRSGGSYSMTANITVNSGASGDSAQLVAETVRAEISRFWEEISISTGALAPV